MNKEEIISKECAAWNTDLYSSQLKPHILNSMDQYAEQEAIFFGEWLKKAAWSHSPYMTEPIIWRLTGNYLMLNPGVENKNYTSTELYDLYKQTIKP